MAGSTIRGTAYIYSLVASKRNRKYVTKSIIKNHDEKETNWSTWIIINDDY